MSYFSPKSRFDLHESLLPSRNALKLDGTKIPKPQPLQALFAESGPQFGGYVKCPKLKKGAQVSFSLLMRNFGRDKISYSPEASALTSFSRLAIILVLISSSSSANNLESVYNIYGEPT
jgi:hypothetical protein